MTSQILRLARSELVTHGWTQGTFKNEDTGAHCAKGVFYAIATYTGSVHAQEACQVLRDCLGHQTVVSWNDKPGRTVEEVLALFDRAIAKAEQQEGLVAKEQEMVSA